MSEAVVCGDKIYTAGVIADKTVGQPVYEQTKEVNSAARKAGAALIKDGKKKAKRKTLIYVNNRLEGNALQTIDAMLEASAA